MAKEVHDIHERLEPEKNGAVAKDMGKIYSQNPRLLRVRDSKLTASVQVVGILVRLASPKIPGNLFESRPPITKTGHKARLS